MLAVIEIKGQQFKVQKGTKLYVNLLHEEEGGVVEFDKVLLLDNAGAITVGTPVVEGAKVTAKVLVDDLQGDKVIVFKKKRRKGYKKKNGHRQRYTQIVVEEIVA